MKQLGDSAVLSDSVLYVNTIHSMSAMNSRISAGSYAPAQNYKSVMDIYLNKILQLDSALTVHEKEIVISIAVQCPYEAGDAVYGARMILSQLDTTLWFYDDVELCATESSAKKETEPVQDKKAEQALNEEYVKVYPNPANNLLNVLYKAETKGEVIYEIMNNLGQGVKYQTIQQGIKYANLDVSSLSVGLYFWRLKDSTRTISNGKVLIGR